MTVTEVAPQTNRQTRPLSEDEQAGVQRLQELTDRAFEIKNEASRIAAERRDSILALRDLGWSYRRIGETIGVSGQRIDSMLRLGDRLAAREEGDEDL